MNITLYGAAGDVTGSAYYLETKKANVLIDFGSFQGGKKAELKNKIFPPINVKKLDAVVLTHSHLDHSGRLPLLVKAGYRNPIYATPATCDITGLILRDSAKVQMFDVERDNRRRMRKGESLIAPLYTAADAEAAVKLLTPINYDAPFKVATGISVRPVEAGHILGSSSLVVTINEDDTQKTIIFSGDLGPGGMAILKDSESLVKADLVFLESTYGDRDHRSLQETIAQGEEIIRDAIRHDGKILIPAFAIGRTQQLLYYMARAMHEGNKSRLAVYLDSPMAIEATKIYMKHLELFDEEATEMERSGELRLDLNHLHTCVTADESRALNFVEGPCLIIAGSGMCNAGRILHHLRHNLWKPETHVIIAGYQAEGTLGRRLVDGAKEVTIFGEKIVVKAHIHLLGGLSAHAGQTDLINWFGHIAPSNPRLILAHGEEKGRTPLAALIGKKFGIRAELPLFGDVIKL